MDDLGFPQIPLPDQPPNDITADLARISSDAEVATDDGTKTLEVEAASTSIDDLIEDRAPDGLGLWAGAVAIFRLPDAEQAGW